MDPEIKEYCKKHFKSLVIGSYGIVASTDLKTVRGSWNTLPHGLPANWLSCYAGYLYNYKKLTRRIRKFSYYVAYPAMPIWFPKLLDDFNGCFDNINLEIVETKTSNLKFIKKQQTDWNHRGDPIKREYWVARYDDEDGVKKFITPIVRFNYSEKYNKCAQYYFNYSLVILMRMISLPERFINPLSIKYRGSVLKYLAKVNNENRGYRSFSEREVSASGLAALADYETVNTAAKRMARADYNYKQTRIFSEMSPKGSKQTKKKRQLCMCTDCRRGRGEI
jgi:hypothetical protein